MQKLKALCVFCGSSLGNNSVYAYAAQELAKALAEADISLVYGGAKVGIMGVLADSMLEAGGKVIGVMPKSLVDKEIAHTELTKLHIVHSMHERKALMAELSGGFIMLPGGAGSLDEFFEAMTWAMLGYHNKPCGILNTNHYFNHLLQFLDHAVSNQFIRPAHRNMLIIESSPTKLLEAFAAYQAPTEVKWIKTLEET